MTRIARIPKCFYDDHCERELPAPPILMERRNHYWVNLDDPSFSELANDARYYADKDGPDMAGGLKTAARALLRACGT